MLILKKKKRKLFYVNYYSCLLNDKKSAQSIWFWDLVHEKGRYQVLLTPLRYFLT